MKVKERIKEWLKEVKEKGKEVEVISFFQELPIKTKAKVIDFDDKFVQWEVPLKLCLATQDCGKVYTQFFDKQYNQNRIIEGNVIYCAKEFIESTFPLPSSDPKFKRDSVRITASPNIPIEVKVLKEDKLLSFPVKDVSENGIGIIAPKESFQYGEKVKLLISTLDKKIETEGITVSFEPYEDREKFGIKLNLKEREKEVLRRYISMRQREVLNKIREIAG
ncbi:PilZ domain-containing protein [Thermovibrio sp.]